MVEPIENEVPDWPSLFFLANEMADNTKEIIRALEEGGDTAAATEWSDLLTVIEAQAIHFKEMAGL